MDYVNLRDYLTKNKKNILDKWFNLIIEVYPSETIRHLKNQKDPFANPLGHNIKLGIEGIFEEILQGMDFEKLNLALDKIVRIKAVQSLSPSQAVSFIYLFKKVVVDQLAASQDRVTLQDFLDLDAKIDNIALMAFEIYMDCREKVNRLRIEEIKKRIEILERVNMFNEKSESTCSTNS